MLADTCKVTQEDGTEKEVMEVYGGGSVVSERMRPLRVSCRTVTMAPALITLLLSNGHSLSGSSTQEVCKMGAKKRFKTLSDIEIGDRLVGIEGGTEVMVSVVGILYVTDHSHRVVCLYVEKPFIVEGVLCRS